MLVLMTDAGKGAVYSFDPVGSYQRDTYKAGGSASAMLQPLLDNQVKLTKLRKWVKVRLSFFFFLNYLISHFVCSTSDWFQEHGWRAASPPDSGEGSSTG